jgi:hypothetical protein
MLKEFWKLVQGSLFDFLVIKRIEEKHDISEDGDILLLERSS